MRSEWFRKTLVGVLATMAAGIAWGQVQIKSLVAHPVSPWGKAVINYELSGTLPADAADYCAYVVMSNRTSGVVLGATAGDSYLSGDTQLALGKHQLVFDVAKAGIECVNAQLDFTVSYRLASRPAEGSLYCVIDLSGGTSAVRFPVSYLKSVPAGGWSDEYKTTKLVLRRIEAGTFIMGSDQTDESHRVWLTKPFYLGVFEVTQKQWELVMGTRPWAPPDDGFGYDMDYGWGDSYPAYAVSYAMIRGERYGAEWPAAAMVDEGSFMHVLRAKTDIDFDLATEAQWEYACRAGTTTTFYWGDTMDDDYALHFGNAGYKSHMVGLKKPNAWGLYDMAGNVRELCLDWQCNPEDHNVTPVDLPYGVDPKGVSVACYSRVARGGCWIYDFTLHCASGERGMPDCPPNFQHEALGFRLARPIAK